MGTVKSGGLIFVGYVARVALSHEAAVPPVRLGEQADAIRLETDSVPLVIHAPPPAVAAQIEIAVPPVQRSPAAVKLVLVAVDSLHRVHAAAPDFGDGDDREGNQVPCREAADGPLMPFSLRRAPRRPAASR